MVVSNSTFQDTQNGIRIKTNRRLGGPISNITYSNLAMDGVQQPIAFADYYPDVPATGDESTEAVGQTTPRVSDVRVSNLQASRARSAGWIVGLPGAPMYNIVLQDVTVEAFTGLTVRHAAVTMTRTRIDVVNGPEVLFESGAPVQLPTR